MADITREEIKAELAATEARVQAVESRIDASLAALRARIEHLPGTWTLVTSIAASTVATIGVIIGVLAFGGDRFDGGVQVSTIAARDAVVARQMAEEVSAKVEQQGQQLDTIIELLNRRLTPQMPDNPQ